MALTNRQLRKQLKDALADTRDVVSSKIAARSALSASEKKFLKNALADMKHLADKLAQGIGAGATPAVPGTNEVQLISFSAVPDAGTFTLTFNGQTTAAIAFNALAADVKAALELLGTVRTVNVTGDFTLGFSIEFAGADGEQDQSQITAPAHSLTAAAVPVVITPSTTTPGVAGVAANLGVQLTTVEQKELRSALADQQGELTAKIAGDVDFSS